MNDTHWDRQLKTFLRKTGDELKRAGEEIKKEGERLIGEVRDPDRHRKVTDSLKEIGTWAKRTAEEVADLVEKGVKKAEDAVSRVAGQPTPPAAPPAKTARPKSKAKSKKTLGRKRKSVR